MLEDRRSPVGGHGATGGAHGGHRGANRARFGVNLESLEGGADVSSHVTEQYARLQVHKTQRPLPKAAIEDLGFGKVIADHMLKVTWTTSHGWSAPEIVPSGPIGLHPFSHVFHYAIECYEGMKVFRDSQGKVRMFRPEKNMSRFNQSAHRLCLPQFNEDELLRCIQALVLLDKDWIPQRRGCAMYLRPVMFSTTPWLGLTQCSEAMLFVLQSPVGPYFKSGYVPIMLHVEQKMIRAWPGGTGNFKCGGNYGPTVSSQIVAARSGCSQALYVYDDKNLWVTEAGTMNIFFLWITPEGKKQLVTPTLADGTILPGITRRSVMELAESWGECEVVEKMLPLREVILASEEGRLLEAFGTGTAAVIQPVQGFIHEGKSYLFPEEGSGPASLQSRLVKRLTDIQYGEVPHPWSIVLE